MRERRYLTFDMENLRHREAFALFSAQSAKQRSEYVVDCIIKTQDENRMAETITADYQGSVKRYFIFYSHRGK